MAMELRLLGNIEARIGDRPVEVGPARQRFVLAALSVDANRVVPLDGLVERVWGGGRLPVHPHNALHTYVALLRRVLAPAGDVTITRQAPGYRLTAEEAAVDVHRFLALLDQARATDDDERAAARYERALALWRGEPFESADTAWFAAVRAMLTRQRNAARLDLTDIRLRRGEHTELVVTLADEVAENPLDERLAGQYLLALCGCGRQADALQHYDRVRRQLADELGVDPSRPLRRLHHQILTGDPALPDRGAAPPPVAAAKPTPVTRPAPVPRQLPAAPRLFTGRTAELAALTELLGGPEHPAGTVVIGGAGGIGKTWLALHWAYRNLDLFPDGQLHVNLRGFDPSGEPVTPAAAVRGFLDALGVAQAAVPADLDGRVGLYRSLVADKRLLVVLDNAADTAQVTPLLPGGTTATVLITSRRRLTGLVTAHCARLLPLRVLDDAEARRLLAGHLGEDRLAAEPEAVAELLDRCAGMPLALGIIAARAHCHPDFPLAALAEEFHDHAARLDALDTGHTDVNLRAVVSWSYRTLAREPATVFGLLGLAPGSDIGEPAAAGVSALPAAAARTALQELENAHLVDQHTPGRYRMHDLVRLCAADQARRDLPDEARTAALRRLADFYLHTAYRAERLLEPHRPPIALDEPAPGCHPLPLDHEGAAVAWLTVEYPNVLAVQQLAVEHGWHATAWGVAWSLYTFQRRHGYQLDALAVWQAALAAAERLDDPVVESTTHRAIGSAYSDVDRHREARSHLLRALAVAEEHDDLFGQAHAHHLLASALEEMGSIREALAHSTRSVDLFRAADLPVWEAWGLGHVGWCRALLGELPQARVDCEAALDLARRHGDREGESLVLDTLGYIAHHAGRYHEALDHYRRAVALLREVDNPFNEAEAAERLGDTHHALGEPEQATEAWRHALRLYQAQQRASQVERLQRQLDVLGRSRAGC
ncbi:AfsR/SARP family transcriptional regulator [Saccharothrix australiensis]|uniref:DNA-binding SARP family transcriptional activator n=1 Tax=Saccharothrix australiensis TaxID=2072 RepID=A0A495W6L3_9PSEU|nr:BTAD domain-containing putative transcriptional regulator [Saccharothrix australiensis]RKT56730.1 DNA-binding SARP family transcriptional activator [Saccharothrix australiensis]